MTDLEMTKLCAEAMGFQINSRLEYPVTSEARESYSEQGLPFIKYDPLHNDAQCMALVKKFGLEITRNGWTTLAPFWMVTLPGEILVVNADLNRAAVECIAKMSSSSQSANHGKANS